jgi:hypothetical protein
MQANSDERRIMKTSLFSFVLFYVTLAMEAGVNGAITDLHARPVGLPISLP